MKSVIRILIIDDSIVFREALARGLSHEPRFKLLPTVSSPIDALQRLSQLQPDLIVCDIEMPEMNGIEFLRKQSHLLRIPVIMLSSRDDLRALAIKEGAAAFLGKPKIAHQNTVRQFILELMSVIMQVYTLHQGTMSAKLQQSREKEKQIKLIAIGASTGGTESIAAFIQQLPVQMPPIVIAQHIPEQFSTMFAKRLNELTSLTVKEASKLEPLLANHVYIAPGNEHMSVKLVQGQLMIQCKSGEKINGHRPSVDVLFSSVANVVKEQAIGVILTGMGKDGALGLLQMRQAGCFTIGQDEKTSIIYGMPKAAYDVGAVCKQVPLHRIAHEIVMKL